MKINLNLMPLDIAKKLVELGYDYEVLYTFVDDTHVAKLEDWTVIEDTEKNIPCPLATHVLQWFRENKDIQIFPLRIGNVTMPFIGYSFITFFPDDNDAQYSGEVFESEEESILAGIKYVLERL